jgi:anaerobic selenocysteine-containing dehydrogenase
MSEPTVRQVQTFCALCVSRCGATATVEDGRFIELGPDPAHPTGQAVCVKGKAAPAIVAHRDRLLHPMRRTAPKGAADPGWVRISWDEALDTVAARLTEIAAESGPEAVAFASASPSTSALSDSVDWIVRLRRAFGSPNYTNAMELCGWGRHLASTYTYGAPVPGAYMPDLADAACILYWGYNPSVSRLVHATATVQAVKRGARLVVVDPRRVGLAAKADHWLRVRPGTDAALALGFIHVMLERGWYDEAFVRRWTDAPLLVRTDTGRLLDAGDLTDPGPAGHRVGWDAAAGVPVAFDPAARAWPVAAERLALAGTYDVPLRDGVVACRPVLEALRQHCEGFTPDATADLTGVPAEELEATAETLWTSRPLAFYTWSGLEQHSTTTQTIRAINVLYALTGCLDVPGGNVLFAPVATAPIDGAELLAPAQRAKALGLDDRPLGPARFEFVTGEDLYTAALESRPYRVRGLVDFGGNLVMAHGDSARGRDALTSLDFFVHADLFLSPTAALADIVLPVASPFESEALRVGFEVSQRAQAHVQLRQPVVPPRGEARSDLQIVFDLAVRLGLGDRFWDGDLEAAWRHQLGPSGLTLEQLRAEPRGITVPLATTHHKHEGSDGRPPGFRTPSGLVELWSETLQAHGYPPLPTFTEPAESPRSRPDLSERFPLVLTCAKSLRFCETQHRQVVELRSAVPDPQVELHPDAAAARGIDSGAWVRIDTPRGSVRARAKLNASLAPDVVCGQHGWSQGCEELGIPDEDPYAADGLNLNLVLSQTPSDPISGSSPLRSSVCQISAC